MPRMFAMVYPYLLSHHCTTAPRTAALQRAALHRTTPQQQVAAALTKKEQLDVACAFVSLALAPSYLAEGMRYAKSPAGDGFACPAPTLRSLRVALEPALHFRLARCQSSSTTVVKTGLASRRPGVGWTVASSESGLDWSGLVWSGLKTTDLVGELPTKELGVDESEDEWTTYSG
ncbi:hypothetical protein CSOJ01_00491 [Colletotrichum sojae]|uniref:Uncharacterized protein n=1 Tax=Colletotrichum sojae TaxID=2175907 RepID=A0A8H6N6B1_9PEZI|nr:hypothetical protein CSOJ01_00491 [Colletotrichum sojae]